jgi:uncharacterized protein
MRTIPRRAVLLFLPFAWVNASCSSSPPPQLYTLGPVPGAAARGGPRVVVMHQVAVPRFLERPEIVRSSEGYRLDVLANEQWGEPLAQMIGRVLSDDLTQRLPGTTVFSANGAIVPREDATVAVNIQRMDRDATGTLVFAAQAAIAFDDPRQPRSARSVRTSIPISSAATIDEVQAMSVGLGQLADTIAEMLRQRPTVQRKG